MYSDITLLKKEERNGSTDKIETYTRLDAKCLQITRYFTTASEEVHQPHDVEFREEPGFLRVTVSRYTAKRCMDESFQIRKSDVKLLKEFLNQINTE